MDSRADDVCRIFELITAAWGSQAVRALAELSVAEHLADGPRSAAEVARREGANPAATSRLLRAATAVSLLVDVGGAEGAFAAGLLREHPDLRSYVLEPAPIIPRIAAEARRRGPDDRLVAVEGDFFTAVPTAEVYLLKFVLHDRDDDACIRILSTIRGAMAPAARLCVVEMLATDCLVPLGLAYTVMMFEQGGQERDLRAYDALFARAGLRRADLRQLGEPYVVKVASTMAER